MKNYDLVPILERAETLTGSINWLKASVWNGIYGNEVGDKDRFHFFVVIKDSKFVCYYTNGNIDYQGYKTLKDMAQDKPTYKFYCGKTKLPITFEDLPFFLTKDDLSENDTIIAVCPEVGNIMSVDNKHEWNFIDNKYFKLDY